LPLQSYFIIRTTLLDIASCTYSSTMSMDQSMRLWNLFVFYPKSYLWILDIWRNKFSWQISKH